MTRIAWRSLRRRWAALVGTFAAVAFGVALTAATGLGLAASAGLPDGVGVAALDAMLGTACGIGSFVSVFVVASTFSYAVARRRPELGLLRLAGATPRQLRRLVLAEAGAVGFAGSATGCALGKAGAPLMARWCVHEGLAPDSYGIGQQTWPLVVAFWTGLLVALCGAYAAARRAGRVGPLEALREAAVDEHPMTAGRWIAGAGLVALAVGLAGWDLGRDPADLLKRKTWTWQPMLLITACGLLAPVLVRPAVRLLAWAPARMTSYAGRLVRANACAGVRRTAAVAAPVLVMVALTGSLLGSAATVGAAKAADERGRTSARFVVTGAGLPRRLAAARVSGVPGAVGVPDMAGVAGVPDMSGVPGAVGMGVAPTRLTVLEEGFVKVPTEAWAVDPAALAAVATLPLVAGSVSGLDDGGIIVTREWRQHTVGQSVPLWLADGTRTRLRIVAVMRTGTGGYGAYVTPHNAPGARVTRIEVKAPAGAEAALRRAMAPYGGVVRTTAAWVAATHPRTSRETRLGFVLVLGIALLYTAIALANTLVTATADRFSDLALLRLAGATRAQVLRVVTAESLLAIAAGALLGAAVTALDLAETRAALARLGTDSPMLVPWPAMAAVTATCAALAVTCTLIPAAWSLRTRRPTAALTG